MTTQVMIEIDRLYEALDTIAPKLVPQPCPHGMDQGNDLATLLHLCKTNEQKNQMKEYILKRRPEKGAADILRVIGRFNTKSKAFEITRALWVTEADDMVHHFNKFLELQFNASTDQDKEEAQDIAEYFLSVNGHGKDDIHVAEECFTLAYALQILLRAFPSVPIVVKCGDELLKVAQDSDVERICDCLFDTSTKPMSGTGKRKASRNKQTVSKKLREEKQ